MNETNFKRSIIGANLVFMLVFIFYTLPEALAIGDIIEVFLAGFVNPISSGYSTDVIMCWFILLFWVLFEAKQYGVRWGWICALTGAVPGVAFGFCLYLIIRHKQLNIEHKQA